MPSIVALIALMIAVGGFAPQRPSEITPEMTALETRLIAKTDTKTRTWIKQEATRQGSRTAEPGKFDEASWRKYPHLSGDLSGADIEALAFLVLMEAAKSAREDLKGVMTKVKSINAAKESTREKTATKTEIGEAASLRLQATSDRHAKLLETASNLMKKMAEAGSTTVRNLK